MNQGTNLTLNWGVVLKFLVVIVCLYILFLLKDIIIWFIFALIISVLFNFVIDFLERKRIPRLITSIILYCGVFVLLSFFVYKIAPILLSEIKEFVQNIPYYLQKVSPFFEKLGIEAFRNTESLIKVLETNLGQAGQNIFNALFSVFGGAASTLFIIILSFFISLEKEFGEKILTLFAPKRYENYLLGLWRRSKQKVSGWFISRIIGAVFVAILSYLVLRILNVPYALVLSLMVGLLDFVPYVGPLIGGTMVVFLVMINSFNQALFVLISFIIIQQLESSLLIPILCKKLIKLSPVLVLMAIVIGGKLWGILGAFLAIPLAAVIYEVLKDYLARRRREPVEIL